MSADVLDDMPTFILPRLFLGSIDAARNVSGLQAKGIVHVLRCCRDEDVADVDYDPKEDLPNTQILQWHDNREAVMDLLASGEMEIALDYLRAKLTVAEESPSSILRPAAVLVHCIAGRSRSAAVVVAWLVVSRGLTLANAVSFVKEARPWVDPNPGFVSQLQILESSFFSAVQAVHSEAGAIADARILRWLPRLCFAPQFVDMIRRGEKCATTRLLGIKDTDSASEKHALLVGMPCAAVADGKTFAVLRVDRFDDRTFANIDDGLARIETMQSAAELKAVLCHFYPGAADDDSVRVIYFSLFRS